MITKNLIIIGARKNIELLDLIDDINLKTKEKINIEGYLYDYNEPLKKGIRKEIKILGSSKDWKKFKKSMFLYNSYSHHYRFKIEKKIKELKIPNSKLITLIHPDIKLREGVQIGKGTVVLKNVEIMNNVKIKTNCLINMGVIINADAVIGSNCELAPYSLVGDKVLLGKNCFLGIKSVCLGKIKIANGTRINANTICERDIKHKKSIVFGTPGRTIGFDNF